MARKSNRKPTTRSRPRCTSCRFLVMGRSSVSDVPLRAFRTAKAPRQYAKAVTDDYVWEAFGRIYKFEPDFIESVTLVEFRRGYQVAQRSCVASSPGS